MADSKVMRGRASYLCDRSPSEKPRVLLLEGGWEGHSPTAAADYAQEHLLSDCEVIRSGDLGMLDRKLLAGFDVLVPIWTFGALGEQQEQSLLEAIARGMGMVAWHGFASAFLASRAHKFLLGGQFVSHPGGEQTAYRVHFHDHDPLVDGLEDFTLTSEQYYMLMDPAVKVLASTRIVGQGMPWLAGVEMPVAWKRIWGQGRVFYCSLGHAVDVLAHEIVSELIRRAVQWAAWAASGSQSLRSH
jgi:uncharacterized protein